MLRYCCSSSVGRFGLVKYRHAAAGFDLRPLPQLLGARRSISDYDQDTTSNVRDGMQQWIQKYVVEHRLCPFAARSNHRIVVYPWSEPDTDKIRAIVQKEVDRLPQKQMNDEVPNFFLVFPYVNQGFNNFGYFDGFTCSWSMPGGLLDGVEALRYHPDFQMPMLERMRLDAMTKKVFVLRVAKFIRNIFEAALPGSDGENYEDNKYIPFKSPWPAVQFFRTKDLEAARNSELGRKMHQNNRTTLSSVDTVEELDRIRRACAAIGAEQKGRGKKRKDKKRRR